MAKRIRKTETVPPTAGEASAPAQVPAMPSYLYNGGVVSTMTINGEEYTLRPGRPINLPDSTEVDSLIKQHLLSSHAVRITKR